MMFDLRNFHIVAYGLLADRVDKLATDMLTEYKFVYNDYIEDLDKYSGCIISWPQGSKSCCARDLAMNRVYGVYQRKG